MEPGIAILLCVVALVLGAGVSGFICFKQGISYRKKTAEAAVGSAEKEAERIVDDAKKNAETLKKEAKRHSMLMTERFMKSSVGRCSISIISTLITLFARDFIK